MTLGDLIERCVRCGGDGWELDYVNANRKASSLCEDCEGLGFVATERGERLLAMLDEAAAVRYPDDDSHDPDARG